jgi:hypothetical protein
MPLIDITYKHSELHYELPSSCQIIYLGSQATIPLEKEFIDYIHSLSVRAYIRFPANMCDHRAEWVAEMMAQKRGLVSNKLIMDEWFPEPPLNKYSAEILLIRCSFHSLAYCEYKNLFIACHCNYSIPAVNPEAISDRPYVQIFASENRDELLDLLNAVYAFKTIHFAAPQDFWSSVVRNPSVLRKVYSHPVALSRLL